MFLIIEYIKDQPCMEVSQSGWWWYSVAMVKVLRKTRNITSQ